MRFGRFGCGTGQITGLTAYYIAPRPQDARRGSSVSTFRRKQYLGPRPPTRKDSKFVRSDAHAGAYEVSAGTCECKDLIIKRFIKQQRGYCCKHMKAAFPKPAAEASKAEK